MVRNAAGAGTAPPRGAERASTSHARAEPIGIPPEERRQPLPDQHRTTIPLRGLLISVLALVVGATVSLSWPASVNEYSGFVWILALVPLFLLAYYRGWVGSALAAVAAMAAFSLVEVVVVDLIGQPVDWWLFGTVVVLLAAVSIGTGWLSELLHREREAAARLAYEDPLTLLPSRRALDFFLDKQLAAARRGQELSVVFFDLDDFKAYNDRHGHGAGDRFLYRVGEVLSGHTREENLTGRYGGEEFLAVLAGEDAEGARAFAERVRRQVGQLAPEDRDAPTISAGVAGWERGMVDDSELLTRADQALYRAKARGGDRVEVWSSPES